MCLNHNLTKCMTKREAKKCKVSFEALFAALTSLRIDSCNNVFLSFDRHAFKRSFEKDIKTLPPCKRREFETMFTVWDNYCKDNPVSNPTDTIVSISVIMSEYEKHLKILAKKHKLKVCKNSMNGIRLC